MCGIAGIIGKDNVGQSNIPLISKAIDALHFRGPDNKGVFSEENIGLGHARLSIIDTSNEASQPFHSQDGRYIIVFNGEIYNYKELKQPLERLGVNFKTTSDTEVLLYHLIENGKQGLKDLNGFFAFSLYDRKTKKILIARDRFGIKPLHIYEDNHQIIWGSEMKAIFSFSIIKKLNHSSLQMYLKFNYIPQPYSILENCSKLEPGYLIEIDKNHKITKEQYYKVDFKNNEYNITSYKEAQNKLREVLEESVVKRMVADVPLGAFLSGGIDSSVIVSLASKHTQNLNTFSIGYKDEPMFDETKYARLVADKYKTNLSIIKSVIKSNENRSSLLLNRVFKILKNKIRNKKICFLGVTFKANTDDMRDSSSLSMIPSLIKKGAKINYFDPTGEKKEFKKIRNVNFSTNINAAIKDSDLIIIHTEWNDFKSINFKKQVNKKNYAIFDMRNIYSESKMKNLKIKYFSVGR